MGFGELLSGLANAGGTVYEIIKDQHLTGAQREANQFSASQAEIARDWQEEMYNKYESPQAMIRQYQDAGLNPALMYGGAGSPSPSFSPSSPQSVTPTGGDVVGALNAYAQLSMLRSQIQLNDAKSRNLDISTWSTEQLTPVQVEEAASRIRKNDQDVNESEARSMVLSAEFMLKSKEIGWYDAMMEVEQLERLSMTHLNQAKESQVREQIANIKQDTLLKAAQTAATWANKGLISQQTANALATLGLIEQQTYSEGTKGDYYAASAGLASAQEYVAQEEERKVRAETENVRWVSKLNEYNFTHADGNRIWNRIDTGFRAANGYRSSGAQLLHSVGSMVPGIH